MVTLAHPDLHCLQESKIDSEDSIVREKKKRGRQHVYKTFLCVVDYKPSEKGEEASTPAH